MTTLNEVKLKLKQYIVKKVDKKEFEPVKIIQKEGVYYLLLKSAKKTQTSFIARSLDGFDFDLEEQSTELPDFPKNYPAASIVKDYYQSAKKVMYFGDKHLFFALLSKNKRWMSNKKSLIDSPYPLEIGGAFEFANGILVLYFEKRFNSGLIEYHAHLAEFDKQRLDKIIWQTDEPIWKSTDQWKNSVVRSLGSVMIKNKILTYWYVDKKIIYGVYLSGFYFNPNTLKFKPKLKKSFQNPIIKPSSKNHWESFNTLNPAAALIDNKVHLLYRAQGFDYVSTFGYAVTSDGVNIDKRLDYPVYTPTTKYEINNTGTVNLNLTSAGGFGGCEDPRITVHGDRLYMVYVAFDGWSSLRLALTSININDFLKHRWNWEKPVLISPPHVIDKSGCLLPEKIKGKYVFFHRIFPDILIDFVDDLNFRDEKQLLKGQYKIKIRPGMWDSRKIGAGAPPLKTKDGWLLIYYGVNDKDASKYHIGAMLLDSDDPTKVLHRSNSPILSPNEIYENNGFKPGIAYPCGAVLMNDNLLVYYGAADSTVCVAQAKLEEFLQSLKKDSTPRLTKIEVREINY